MPPKFKFTRDEITSTALNLTRKAGYNKNSGQSMRRI